MKLVVFYTELADYTVHCFEALAKKFNLQIKIIYYPINAEAPFSFDFEEFTPQYLCKKNFTFNELKGLVDDWQPDALYVAGWTDKQYNKIAKYYSGKIPVVLGFDTKWTGGFRQLVASLFSSFLIRNKFDRCFVPGFAQKRLAIKLGFKNERIQTGAYSANYPYFSRQFDQFKANKKIPHVFLYVGRLVPHKGVMDLFSAFTELPENVRNDWELWCVGTGDLFEKKIEHEKIKYFGFVQPENLAEIIAAAGVFVLPSHFEPWGVVVHEFAASGFPLVLSDQVGAGETFLVSGENGYSFHAGNKESLKDALVKIIGHSQMELQNFSEKSHALASLITPNSWAEKLYTLLTI